MKGSIGDTLQQARKHLGISLTEASEKTKIRADFLARFEQDDRGIPLPDVYRRGFLKSYARFLKLNPQVLLNEYVKSGTPEESLALPETDTTTPIHLSGETNGLHRKKFLPPVSWITGLVLALFFLTVLAFRRHPDKHCVTAPTPGIISEETVTLVGLGPVQVFVRQEENKKRLFSDTLDKGDRRAVTKSGPVQISYS
ncbi:MAG: helix-turn-helix domain-containing protein, partial [Puniceicoccales bacterium]|nr:helix-turn-helix domain-containing protein [Puniceicoccales bacterium]